MLSPSYLNRQTIHDYYELRDVVGDHPTMYFFRGEENGDDISPSYDVGVCLEGSPTLLLNSEKDKGCGTDDIVVVAVIHQYGISYYRNLQIDQEKSTAYNTKRDAFWNFLET